jgi:NAD(P)-dependent dehydrogenase (short-subunit alcohol dehydrogenase family)
MKIDRSIVLITGTRRIGNAIARDLAEAGARVALLFRHSRQEAETAASTIREQGGQAMVLQADLRAKEEIEAAVRSIQSAWGDVNVLINVAAIYQSKPLEETTEADWNENLDVNLKSAFLCSCAVLPGMRRSGGGRIINFADWTAASGRPRYRGYLPYYVSKMGVIGLTQALALELASDNILVNAIAPGPILPPPDISEKELEEVHKATPLGRWGGETEIAKAVRGLIESDFITGECLRVDGGRHIF